MHRVGGGQRGTLREVERGFEQAARAGRVVRGQVGGRHRTGAHAVGGRQMADVNVVTTGKPQAGDRSRRATAAASVAWSVQAVPMKVSKSMASL